MGELLGTMRDVLATHRDVGLFGIRHRTYMIVLLVLLAVQLLYSLGASSSDPFEGSLETYVKSVRTKRVALIVPLHDDHTKMLAKRFRSWNGKRFPCLNRREHHMMDLVFYMGAGAQVNSALIETDFTNTEARKCFAAIRFVSAPSPPPNSIESEEVHSFYRVFDVPEIKSSYDVFMYMSPKVWQVQPGWADKIYEEAVLSDNFWVRGSAAMATCPQHALTHDGDCDGSIGLAFPAVVHINVNALYSVNDSEFNALRKRAEQKYQRSGPAVAIFKELVSTDHPITQKLRRGAQRKFLSVDEEFHHRDVDPSVSHARTKSGHVTSLYWAAHAHRYQYSDFIVNALAGKRHFKEDLRAGHHPNCYLVHQGLAE